jgi:hypothetical protein
MTLEDAAARGAIWTAVHHQGQWVETLFEHQGTVLSYTRTLVQVLEHYQNQALTWGRTDPSKYMTAHAGRVIKQGLWCWALRNRAQVEAVADPNRVQVLDLFDFFYTHTVNTLSERENFGSHTVNQLTGWGSVPDLAKMLIEEKIYG